MIYLVYIIVGFATIQFIVSIINLVVNQKISQLDIPNDTLISILIPARNEEKNISKILNDCLIQTYNNIEILVLDDDSTDKTAKIVSEYCKKDSRIQLLQTTSLPTDWLGKNYACHQLAKHAKGKFLLYLDADVRIKSDLIVHLVSFATKHKTKLLSVFPKQTIITKGEWKTVPLMNYILLSLLPLFLVRCKYFPSLSAANGQCMLFESSSYKQYQPHQAVKNKAVEDIEIARLYKRNRLKVACLASIDTISCRMYEDYNEAINGFSKNCLSFFGNSMLAASLFWILTSAGFLILVFFPFYLIFYLILVIFTRIFIAITSNQSIVKNLQYAVYQQYTLGLLIWKAYKNKMSKNQIWKDRNIYQ